MFNLDKIIGALLRKVVSYVQTILSLVKLKAVDKTSDLLSSFFTRMVLLFVLVQIIILLNIGLSILLGQLMGHLFLGFFAVTFFYVVLLIVLSLKRKPILHGPLKNYFIRMILK